MTARASVVVPTATPQSALSAPLLQVQGLAAWYGAAQVLFGVDVQVGRGEVVALMGRNGAGKSTTLKAIVGLEVRREIQQGGRLRFLGRDIARSAPYQVARMGLGYVPEERRIFTDLSVLDNLEVGRQVQQVGWQCKPSSNLQLVRKLEALPPLPQRLHCRHLNLRGAVDLQETRPI